MLAAAIAKLWILDRRRVSSLLHCAVGAENQSLKCVKVQFSNLASKCSAKFALFSVSVYHVMFCTYYSPEGEMCCNTTDHA